MLASNICHKEERNGHIRQTFSAGGINTRGGNKSGSEMSTNLPMKELSSMLHDLTDEQLNYTSVVSFRYDSDNPKIVSEYVKFILVDDESEPKCPAEKLPMNNRALRTEVVTLSDHFGSKGQKKERAFIKGGFPTPGYSQVTLSGTGLSFQFHNKTGECMTTLSGSISEIP